MKIKISWFLLGLACALGLGAFAPIGSADDGRAKPDFALRDSDGAVRRLSEFRGKWVVLEWTNFACPSVRAHYQAPARTVPTLQRTFKAKGVVWLSINSTPAGTRGHLTPQQGKGVLTRMGASPTALLLDPTGAVGKQFRVVVTPEVRVISPRGDVVYAGGVESTGPGARSRYLETVLNAATTGRAIPFSTQPAQGTRIVYGAATSPSAKGPKAPNFALVDSHGVTRRLSDYRGKWVVLEWINFDCPYVKAQYQASYRSMQILQARSARQGIVWLSICSSARGKEGHLSSAQANARIKQMGASPTAYLHDRTGAVGRSFGAKTTPDMRIISPQGTIEYVGGIGTPLGVRKAGARNFVALALADIAARRPIAIRQSRPVGCSVKY